MDEPDDLARRPADANALMLKMLDQIYTVSPLQ
jgi:hypothetical protein